MRSHIALVQRFQFATLVCVVGLAGICAGSVHAQAVSGSSSDLGSQVVGPATSPTLHSTYDLSGNDRVRWTTYLQPRLNSPWQGQALLTLPAGNSWVTGGAVAASNYVPQWQVGGSWTSSEPASGTAVSAVKWQVNPMYMPSYSPIAGAVDFNGTGDGFRVIAYKDRLFVLNHHNTDKYLKCRLAADGSNCPGWDSDGYSFVGTNDTVLDTNATWYTANISVEALNQSTGELFSAVTKPGGGSYLMCANLETKKSCGSWQMSSSSSNDGGHSVANLEQAGHKFFMVTSENKLRCFDIVSKTSCGAWSHPGSFAQRTSTVLVGDRLYFSPGSGKVFCHVISSGSTCSGWSASGKSGGGVKGVLPYLAANGTLKGVCLATNGNDGVDGCFDASGNAFTPSSTYKDFVGTYVRKNTHHMSAIQGAKWFASGQNKVGCFNFAANGGDGAACGNWATSEAEPYTTRMDPTRPNCLLAVGHTAHASIIDVNTGGACSGGLNGVLPDIDVNPSAYYQCDAGRSMVSAWSKVRMSHGLPWGGSGGLDSIKVTLKDPSGALLPAPYNVPLSFANGAYEVSIAHVPYAQYPKLKVSIELHSPGTLPAVSGIGIDVTWDGDPIQMCATTKQPAQPDCASTSTVDVKTREFDYTPGQFQEVLPTKSWTLSPGGMSYGYAAVSSATTPRANVNALGPFDPKTYVMQGRWSLQQFTGDLWAFGLQNNGQIDGANHFSAQAATGAPTSRPMYTAPPATTAIQPVKSLTAGQLNAAQLAALNINKDGADDGQGAARLAYLRGVDGPFRARGGSVLGPVINSGVAVLPKAPVAGLNEAIYPGYAQYRSAQTRTNPLVLFGGNDGALHAYESLNGGLSEAWSFVPDVMLRRASRFSDPDIMGIRTNPYFVDNVPMVGHANTGANGWRAVAVVTYGRGARAITALDITKTDLASGKGVFFEYTNTTHPDLKDLGYIISQPKSDNVFSSPQVVHLKNGSGSPRGAVLVGNGIQNPAMDTTVSSTSAGKAVLYAFFFDQSAPRWHRWAVDELWGGTAAELAVIKQGNGLSTPTAVDTKGDGKVDLVYAGDIQGNLWRFDISNPGAAVVTRLFKTPSGQPITQAPQVTRNVTAPGCFNSAAPHCWQVVFSTGAPISPIMGTNITSGQGIYSVLDKGEGASVGLGSLHLLGYSYNTVVAGAEYRALQGGPVNYQDGKLGWRVGFSGTEQGVGSPRTQPNGLLMLSSIQPTIATSGTNVCTSPRSWLNLVDPVFGISSIIPFDTNDSGTIDDADLLSSGATARPPASIAISGAQYAPPMVLLSGSNASNLMSLILPGLGQDTSQANSWSGGGAVNTSGPGNGSNSKGLRGSDKKTLGRITWRQVQ